MAFLLDAATQLLQRSHAEGRLAHAYLITGPTGSGKSALALRLVQMTGHQAQSLDAAPREFVQLVRPESKSRRIRVEAMRALEKRMHLAVPDGVTKIGIVFDADRLLPEAANAFLKTLEEPPPQSLLLLLTPHPEQLLDTILSRCLKIPLHSNVAPQRSNAETMLLEALAKHFTAEPPKGLSGALGFMQAFVEILKSEKAGLKKTLRRRPQGRSRRLRKNHRGRLVETARRALQSPDGERLPATPQHPGSVGPGLVWRRPFASNAARSNWISPIFKPKPPQPPNEWAKRASCCAWIPWKPCARTSTPT